MIDSAPRDFRRNKIDNALRIFDNDVSIYAQSGLLFHYCGKTKMQTSLANKFPAIHCACVCRSYRNSQIIRATVEYIERKRMMEGTVAFLCTSKGASDRLAVKNKRNKKIPDALRSSGLPRGGEVKGRKKEGRKEGWKEGRVKEKGEGSMAAACWQFFKESVRRLTGMNDPPLLSPSPPLFSALRGPFFPSSSLLLRSTVRKSGALRGSHMRPHERILL